MEFQIPSGYVLAACSQCNVVQLLWGWFFEKARKEKEEKGERGREGKSPGIRCRRCGETDWWWVLAVGEANGE